jgi:hypothetical protein
MNLGVLSRLGFIERRNKIIYEGSMLDLAFDYEQLAPRIINGALGNLLAGKTHASEPALAKPSAGAAATTGPQSTESLVMAAAAALNRDEH